MYYFSILFWIASQINGMCVVSNMQMQNFVPELDAMEMNVIQPCFAHYS